jgi:uncharacterized protein YndB with AHSA1/START domain
MTVTQDATRPKEGVVRFERMLNAPVERVWEYIVDEDLRKTWLAAGTIELVPGGRVNLHYDQARMTDEPLPEDSEFDPHEEDGTIIEVDPPRLLSYTWGEWFGQNCIVRIELTPEGDRTKLVLEHQRIATIRLTYDVMTGWHGHLDLLEDRINGGAVRPFRANFDAVTEKYNKLYAEASADQPA